MATITDNEEDNYNKELYEALMRGDKNEVIQLCQKNQEGPLHIVTIQNDTVLHIATYSEQTDLVQSLLELLPESHYSKMTRPNNIGNTILHEAATSSKMLPAAEDMLLKAPELLGMRNGHGETALFRAARYGKKGMFKFLDEEINRLFGSDDTEEAQKAFHQSGVKSTILHMSILTEHFDLALLIVEKYEYLAGVRDGDGMTALQLLACNPSAFLSGTKLSSIKRFIYSWAAVATNVAEEESCCWIPLCEAIKKKKQRYESALRLAKFLIKKDTSWKATESVIGGGKLKTHKYGQEVDEVQIAPTSYARTGNAAEIALFLATKEGIIEIVKETLKRYPQAVEHIDNHGRTILHVAIKYRQMKIFDLVEKMKIPMKRLIRKTDNRGNSILHMVGIKVGDHAAKVKPNPALQLQEDLHLFERVKKISTTHFTKCVNSDGKSAEVLFATNSETLRKEAKEWLKRTAESCSIVAVLIATVAFAAPYTVPGGPDQHTGFPIFLDEPFFLIFAMADVLSLIFALTSVITFLSILTSPFMLKDFKYSLPQKLMLGVTLLISSVSAMMMAFAATIVLTIRKKKKWTRIVLYPAAFFPATIFVLSYLPLYMSLMNNIKYSLKQAGKGVPRFCSASIRSWLANSFKFYKSKPLNSSDPTQSQATSSTSSGYPSAAQTVHSLV
ncbi:uncharacterized protein LOC132308740 [Cornus florida]|uniref:uncharacterized protein LOC132308740 n=1 Tax=Cornus florida TaxID=4283 RepID=UPI00289D2DE0|nr:uncharacterized protein LOC132308740 [Cornus florida]